MGRLRSVSEEQAGAFRGIDPSRPSIARVQDYLLGGKQNFAIDREASKAIFNVMPETEARQEIIGSRLDLEAQLEAPVASFAYPYGGWSNLSEANRDLVKLAGFRCCCSGFGGTISAGTNPFQLPRIPVSSWYASPHQFGFDVALKRSLESR